jgi:hypothetical protein
VAAAVSERQQAVFAEQRDNGRARCLYDGNRLRSPEGFSAALNDLQFIPLHIDLDYIWVQTQRVEGNGLYLVVLDAELGGIKRGDALLIEPI